MSQDTKFKIVQAPDTRKIKLEVWRRYGDKPDEWFTDESLRYLSVKEFKELGEYINRIIGASKKNQI